MKIIAIIPAGGKGLRSGFPTPKQYLKFNSKEIICYPLETFQKNKFINEIIIAAEPEYFNLLIKIVTTYNFKKVKLIVEGGITRQQSVYNALLSVEAAKDDLIVVHDAARALLSEEVLNNAIRTAKNKGNSVVCIKAKNTLIIGNETVKTYLNRDEVYYVQTPQIFKYDLLLKAFNYAEKNSFIATDESSIVKNYGRKVYISEGSVFNFKITTKEDFELFRKLVKS